jgi:hypothetical protein
LKKACKALAIVASLVTLSCCVEAQAWSQPNNWTFPNYRGAVIGAAVGVGAVTGIVLYVTLHKASITGCTASEHGINSVIDEKDKLHYVLSDQNLKVEAGQRVKLQGKKRKDKSGNLTFQVKKIKREYGVCPVGMAHPSSEGPS